MKKTYIAPEALCVCLDPKSALLDGGGLALSNSEGAEVGWAKENVNGDNNDVTTGGKNVWDEEW